MNKQTSTQLEDLKLKLASWFSDIVKDPIPPSIDDGECATFCVTIGRVGFDDTDEPYFSIEVELRDRRYI